MRTNHLGQPIGPALPQGWTAPPAPRAAVLAGAWARLEPLDLDRHGLSLWRAFAADAEGRMWTYLPFGPFADVDALTRSLEVLFRDDARPFALVDPVDGAAIGSLSYLRIDPPAGSIEVGAIMLSPRAQRTRLATEAMFLLADHAFALGYRRFEWKCDALNEPSRRAAERFGFVYEGTFRQATTYKGRSRDTAWLAIIDADWPDRHDAFEVWLAADNFDEHGRQQRPLRRRAAAPDPPTP